MDNPVLFTAGVFLLLFVLYDFLRTTVSLSGIGPISRVTMRVAWRAGRWIAVRTERRLGMSMRNAIGPGILILIASIWILLHLCAYVLLFASGRSLEVSKTGEPASFVDTVAFAGSAISTLGASLVGPTNGWWDMLSMAAAVNGMVVLTLSVSYVLSIRQTTMQARSWALRYNALKASCGEDDPHRVLNAVTRLGPDLCDVTVALASSPLPGIFVPNDATMSFPQALGDLFNLMDEAQFLTWETISRDGDLAQLQLGLGQFGRHVLSRTDKADFDAARHWSDEHRFPDLERK